MFCKNCGKQLEDGVKFCDGCGEHQGAVAQVESQQPTGKETKIKRNKALFVIGIFLVVLGLARVVDIFFFRDGVKAFDDGVLTAFEIVRLGIGTIGFGGLGAWLIHKNKK